MLPRRGRPGTALLLTVKRQLTGEDLLRLAMARDLPRVAAPMIQRLRASHHAAARHLANGKSVTETAVLVNRTPQRIGDLTRDPAFQELMAYYGDQRNEVDITTANRIQDKLVEVAEIALDEINDRLEDDSKRKEIPVGELRQITTMGLDRTVAPPKQAQQSVVAPTHITFNMGTKDLRPKIIDQNGTPVPEPKDEDES